MNRLILSALLSCSAFFLCGCPPLSKNPISAPESAVADTRLLGKWSNVTLRITPGPSPWMHAEEIDGEAVTKYDFYPTVIGKHRFLNVRPYGTLANGRFKKGTDYFILRYEVTADNTLTLWSIPTEKAARIIRSGKLKGSIDKGGAVYFEDTSENIRKFLQGTNIKALFSQRQNGIYQKQP